MLYRWYFSKKPHKSSKAKGHLQALARRLELWEECNIEDLLYEGTTIQQKVRSDKEVVTIAKISFKTKNLMSKKNGVNNSECFDVTPDHQVLMQTAGEEF